MNAIKKACKFLLKFLIYFVTVFVLMFLVSFIFDFGDEDMKDIFYDAVLMTIAWNVSEGVIWLFKHRKSKQHRKTESEEEQ